jgi:hypothetical protein
MSTNREFARSDENFHRACTAAGIEPTTRQASKFRLGFGKAWQATHANGNGNGHLSARDISDPQKNLLDTAF